jgi:hypothetical protein
MKKNISLIVLFFTLPFSKISYAQVSSGGYNGTLSKDDNMNQVDVGITGGPSLISLRGNDYLKQFGKPAIGFSGGISFQYNFPKIFQLRTEFNFERKGCIESGEFQFMDSVGNVIGTEKWKGHINFSYMTIPVLLRASYGENIKYFADAGIFFGHLFKQTYVEGPSTYFQGGTFDETQFDRLYDFGISGGIGLTFPIQQKFSISGEVRDNFGLLNTSAVAQVNDGTIKTNSTSLLISFAYFLGKRAYKHLD